MITPASSKPPHPMEMQDLRSARSVLKPTEAPEGVTLLELDSGTGEPKRLTELNANIKRLGQLGELSGLMKEKKALEKLAQVRQMVIERKEKMLAAPPVPPEDLKGAAAARVVALAEKQARENNLRFPPPRDQTFISSNKGWNYTVYGDGRVTRSKDGVLTPEQWRETAKSLKEEKALMISADFEAKIAALDKQMLSLRDELGPTAEEELARLPDTLAHFSLRV